MMRGLGISPGQYTVVDSTTSLEPFYTGRVDVRAVYLTNEVLAARAAGHEVNIIYPDDYGIHNYGDALVASDRLISENPDLVQRFVRASLKGWTYAVEHPTEVGALVAKYNPKANVALESEKMTASVPLIVTGEDHIGWMRLEKWSAMKRTLQSEGALAGPVDPQQTFTMQFVTRIYQ